MTFSFGRREPEGGRRRLLLHTVRRAAIIFLLGLGINWLSVLLFHRAHVRIPGVLQRIAVSLRSIGTWQMPLSWAAQLVMSKAAKEHDCAVWQEWSTS